MKDFCRHAPAACILIVDCFASKNLIARCPLEIGVVTSHIPYLNLFVLQPDKNMQWATSLASLQ